MIHTLSYDPATHGILVGSKYWSDFGNALPLVRNFSLGNSLSWEHPLFPGEPTRYHLLFYYLVGTLERIGFRFDWALNIPSIAGFFFLCTMIYTLSLRIFKKHLVSFLSVLFFLFNGSFSWLDFLAKHKISELPQLVHFPSFGPWSGGPIAAFWNLNIYTNQRHLALSFAVTLAIVYIIYASKTKFIPALGILLGYLLLSNQAAFAVAAISLSWLFLYSQHKLKILVSLIGFLPFAYFSFKFSQAPSLPVYSPFFLYNGPLGFWPIAKYWFLNLGAHLILIPIGFVIAPRSVRKIVFIPTLLFIISNLYRFSPDMINNHKFINFVLIIGSMFSAYVISRYKLLLILVPLLILGGVVDIFPVINDNYGNIPDWQTNPDAAYFVNHTPRKAVVLNSNWFFNPASIAGRKIFNGYSYFTWSYGYDQSTRERQAVEIYRALSLSTACQQLHAYNISYVELNHHPEEFIHPNFDLWDSLPNVYSNPTSGVTIYSTTQICPGS